MTCSQATNSNAVGIATLQEDLFLLSLVLSRILQK